MTDALEVGKDVLIPIGQLSLQAGNGEAQFCFIGTAFQQPKQSVVGIQRKASSWILAQENGESFQDLLDCDNGRLRGSSPRQKNCLAKAGSVKGKHGRYFASSCTTSSISAPK
jgi:hypothetical protein